MADQVFNFIATIGLHAPVVGAWTSMQPLFREPCIYKIYKDIRIQILVLDAILNDLALPLYHRHRPTTWPQTWR